jgi:AraC-like DNA-binding protein
MGNLIFYLSIFGLFLSLILLYNSTKGGRTNRLLSLFFLVLSLNMLSTYIMLNSKSTLLCSIFIANFDFTRYLLGPFAFFYIRNTLSDNATFRKSDSWHYVISAIVFIALLPYIFSAPEHKEFISKQIIENRKYLIDFKPSIIYDMLGVKGVYLLRPLQTFIYILFGLYLYIKHLLKSSVVSFKSQRKVINTWLAVFLFLMIIVCITQIAIYKETDAIVQNVTNLSAKIMQSISIFGIIGLLFSPFIFPSILYGLPIIHPKHYKPHNRESDAQYQELLAKHKTSNLLMEEFYLKSMEQQIQKCMSEERPFLKNDFNMTVLSNKVNIPLHHLSYFFREYSPTSFTKMKNEWRVRYAVELMESGELSHFTLETIGMQSGFETRNTFRTSFIKVYGITPKEYVERKKK